MTRKQVFYTLFNAYAKLPNAEQVEIAAPVATSRRRRSSQSLMFSLLPINDSVRNALDAQVRHFSRLVGLANITVAVGVAMEGVEILHDAVAWIKRRRRRKTELAVRKEVAELFPAGEVRPKAESNSDHPRWVKRFTRIGLIVVVAGVVAEWRCGAKLEDAHNAVHEYDLAKLTEADQKAGDAAVSAKTAHDEADAADIKAKAAGIAAGKAQEEADTVSKQAAQLTRDLQSVEDKRAKLQKSLVDLAICNAPRVLPIQVIVGGKTSVDPLKPFAGFQAIIEFAPEAEARRAAYQIARALIQAGWKPPTITSKDDIDDGVAVQQFVGPLDGSMLLARIRSGEATNAVVDFLHSYNWQAKAGSALDKNGAVIEDPKIVPPDGLRIRVGLYPAVSLVVPPGAKEFAAVMAHSDQERERIRKQSQEEKLKRTEEYLKTLTPQQAIEWEQLENESQEQEKLWTERYNGPCQAAYSLAPAVL
jgi:hypothetical protein